MRVNIDIGMNGFLPIRATAGSSGYDLRAASGGILPAGSKLKVPLDIRLEIEPGFEMQIRTRSGLASKHEIVVLNSPGTIDADFRGEVCVILKNLSQEDFTFERGDRVAQAVFAKVETANIHQVSMLATTERGAGGFGSTGK